MKRHVGLAICFSVIWMLDGVRVGHAQTIFGSIVGNVKDASGAIVADAKVTLTNTETAQSREAVTSDTGSYDFPTIPTGTYTIKILKTGFNLHTQTGIVVSANNTVRFDVTLNLGAVSESVSVTGAVALLQTDRAEVRSDVTTEQ